MGIARTDRFPPASVSVNLPSVSVRSFGRYPAERWEVYEEAGAISKMFPLIENGPIPPTFVLGAESCR